MAELATGVVHHAHQRRADQTNNRPLVPHDNDIGDPEVREDVEDVWRGITNSPGVDGVRTNCDPHNDRAESFALTVLDGREASSLKCGVLEAVGFGRRQDWRITGNTMVIKVHLILRDHVGGDDGVSVRVFAELQVEGLGVAEHGRTRKGGRSRRGGRLSSVLWQRLDRGLAPETVYDVAGHA